MFVFWKCQMDGFFSSWEKQRWFLCGQVDLFLLQHQTTQGLDGTVQRAKQPSDLASYQLSCVNNKSLIDLERFRCSWVWKENRSQVYLRNWLTSGLSGEINLPWSGWVYSEMFLPFLSSVQDRVRTWPLVDLRVLWPVPKFLVWES